MSSQFVTVYGKKIEVKEDGTLDLSKMNIKYISDIKGLESLDNLQELWLYGNQITDIKGLESLVNLKTLELGNNQITDIKGLESLANLQELWLYDNQITDIKGLESLANLQYLNLDNNQIPEDLVKKLGYNPKKYVDYCRKKGEKFEGEKEKIDSQFVTVYGKKIEVEKDGILDLSKLNIKDISVVKGLKTLANLRILRLNDNEITEIEDLETLTNLQYLYLSDNKITEIKGLETLAKLKNLTLFNNEITEIKDLKSLVNLQHLYLYDNQITEIKSLKSLVNLQGLNLSGNQITEIKSLETLANLKVLKLNDNEITAINGLESLVNLQSLDLNENQITEIKNLESLANLQYLYLNDNEITEIKSLESLKNLQWLYLRDNKITEINGLDSLVNLQRLYLDNNKIPEDLVKELGDDPKKYVDYCRKKAKRKETERKEAERLEGEKEKMDSQFVTVYGKKRIVRKDGTLDLSKMNIKDISDIKGLESLANLQCLYLVGNQITEIKNLEALDNLQRLYLDGNQVTKIKGLEPLLNLQELYLGDNQITEIKNLEALANLQRLYLDGNQITEIKGLETLTNLEELNLHENQISEIKGLESLVNLEYLGLWKNQISEIKGLESLVNLEELQLDDNQITEIKGLESLANLQKLQLEYNQITEIKGLESLVNLQKLLLHKNQITKIKGLESLADLQILYLAYNQITEIKGLESLVNLQRLYLNDNQFTEIKGLESLANLQELLLSDNQITEIKGLESLADLQTLYLAYNQITEIKGLESLANLKKLNLNVNEIPEDLIDELGDDPQKYIDYCRKGAGKKKTERKEAERLEMEKKGPEDTFMIRKILQLSVDNQKEVDKAEIVRSLNFSFQEANKYFELLNSPIEYESNEVSELIPKAEEIVSKFTEPTLYDLLNKLELDFYAAKKIGKYLIDEGFFKEFPNFPKVKVKTTTFKESRDSGESSLNDVEVLRGGDWKVEGNQSVFYYKVKVKNNSPFVITNIQIILGGIPAGLELKSKKLVEFANLNPKKEVAPTFKLLATDDCVGNEILSTVNFKDHSGTLHSVHTEPFDIEYVCNLLRPKYISEDEFDRTVNSMEEKKLIVDSFLNLKDLESKIEQIVKNCNFALLQDVKGSQDENFAKIEAFAEGIYDKQDVALSVAIQKAEKGSKLVVKAMSDRSEKVTDLLKDFSVKLDDIKSDTELIKEYTSQIELIFDRVDDLEAYLKDHLASDWEKIKDDYADYKEGKITRKQLIGRGIKAIGKRFVKKIIEKVSPI